MSNALGRRHTSDAVKYTPCAKAEQTDEDDIEEIAIVGRNEPSDPQAVATSSRPEVNRSGQNGETTNNVNSSPTTANGPNVLPVSPLSKHHMSNYQGETDRTKLIGERLSEAGRISLSSPTYSARVIEQKSSSKQSLIELVSTRIRSARHSKSHSTFSKEDVAYVNKAHLSDATIHAMTPKDIRKQRRKEIEQNFGKRKKSGKFDRLETSTTSSVHEGCKWTFVFDPAGRLAYWWSLIVSIAFIYNFWVMIYRFAFEEINEKNITIWFPLDYVADLLYILDIAFHFRTGYLEDGVLQTDGTKLRIHYMNSTMFYIDCLCLLPLDFLYLSIGFKSMLRCFRLVKIYRFWAFLDRTERHTNFPNVVRTCALVHYLLAIYHWNACLIYIVSRSLQGHHDHEMWRYPPDVGDVLTNYLHSLYWSTLVLTTMGDLPQPVSKGEYLFVITEFCFGLLLFATILGHVANIVTSISAARKDFQSKYKINVVGGMSFS